MVKKMLDIKLIQAESARRHYIDFVKFLWQRPDEFIIGTHTEEICNAIDESINKYRMNESTYLVIKAPFRHGKSDLLSRYLPSYFIGQFPDNETISTAYAYPLVRTFSRFARTVVKDPLYQYVFPGINISSDNAGLDEWGINNHHGQTHWVGLGGSVTGKGGSLITIDDFFKNREQAESEVIREKVWESVTNDILTRRAPVSIVIILATPWHVDDIFGRLEEKQKEDPNFPNFKELKFPAFSDKYKGGVLFPERFSLSWYTSQKAVLGPYATAGLMQCDPVAKGGNLLRVDKIKFYTEPPEGLVWSRGWDLASTEAQRVKDDPDYTAGFKIGIRWIHLTDKVTIPEIFIDDCIDGRWSAPHRDKVIKATTYGDGQNVIVASESFGPYKDAYENLKQALHGVRTVKKIQLPGDKVSKSMLIEAPMAAGNVWMRKADWNERVIKQLREFPGASHDDYVDSIVVGVAAHDPFVKRVWPQIQGRHIIKLNLDWKKAQSSLNYSLHYVSIWQKPDMSIYGICALWDAQKGFLFVYNSFYSEYSYPNVVIPKIIKYSDPKNRRVDGIICNKIMYSDNTKCLAYQYEDELKKHKLYLKTIDPVDYEEYSSINEVAQLFDANLTFIDNRQNELILQTMGWMMVKKGANGNFRPDEEDDGYCRAICQLVSELSTTKRYKQVAKPKFNDYNNSEIVNKLTEALSKGIVNAPASIK